MTSLKIADVSYFFAETRPSNVRSRLLHVLKKRAHSFGIKFRPITKIVPVSFVFRNMFVFPLFFHSRPAFAGSNI